MIALLFIISIGFASASENITDMQTADERINDGPAISDESPVDVPSAYYVNNTKESSGDGSSWENASKSISLKDNATIYLAEGEYEIPGDHVNVTYIGLGKDTIITSFSFKALTLSNVLVKACIPSGIAATLTILNSWLTELFFTSLLS